MARSRDDNNRMPSTGPHLRYVRYYSIDSDPDQPVKVKYLKWDGTEFDVYGTEIRIGDTNTPSLVSSGQQFWITWNSSALRWMPVGGGGSGSAPQLAQVVDIDEGPNSGDYFDAPYQPVYVKFVTFQGYVAASSGTVATDNSDIEISAVKGKKKHGTRGNGIGVTFTVDAGITPDSEASYDESSDVLAIKVKTTSVLWSAVTTAVAIPLNGAFELAAVTPSAAVGASIGSVTATLSGGDDGADALTGDAFSIGGPETKDSVRIGQKLWIVYRDGAGRWDVLNDGPEIRYVKVTSIVSDPVDDSPLPLQTVVVTELTWQDYKPATSGIVSTDNTDIVISSHKGSEKHGTFGNDITVAFVIDAGIGDNVEVDFDETGDGTLTITVKNINVLWSEVADKMADLIGTFYTYTFSVIADDPTAEVGASIESVTATLAGGVKGDYDVLGNAFLVGDYDLKNHLAIGDKFWIAWKGDAQRWERISGGGGDSAIHFGRVTTQIEAATDWGAPGEGEVQEKNMAGANVGSPANIKNALFDRVLVDHPVWFIFIDGQRYVLVPGCFAGP